MLAKKNRINKKEINQIFKKSSFLYNQNFTLRFQTITKNTNTKVSFIVPKNIAKQAVKRNYLRRLGYRALKQNTNQLSPGFLGVFVFKRYIDDFYLIQNDIKNLLSKIN